MAVVTRFYGTGRRKTSIARVWLSAGNGRILMRIAREQGRKLYEIDIGAGWQINPALAGAIKSFDGVVDVKLN